MAIYSHSRLSTFENCPLQYKFNYIDGIKRAGKGIEAFMGSCFHDVMEKLYKDLKFRTHSVEELLNYYEALWDREYSDAIVITKKDRTAEDYKNIGRKCIEDYYKRYYSFNLSRVLGLERRILIDLNNDGKYQMQGFIDRIDQNEDDTYEIHDYKTSGHLPDQKQLDEDRQLALYHIGIQNVWNDVKKVNLIWHYVVFDKEMTSTRTGEQLDKLREGTIEIISRIENTMEFLPKESNLCEWCMYPDLCPKRKHLYKVEALPVNEYLKDSGVKLVNTFTKLAVEKKKHQEDVNKIEEKMDKLKEAVIKYAEKEDIDVVRGSDHKLKISEKQKISSPPKGSPERHELEDILRKVNKWDEVSALDTNAIGKIITDEQWDRKTIDKIKKFLTIEVKKQVSLSKLKQKEEQ